jgi:hypothetical protein
MIVKCHSDELKEAIWDLKRILELILYASFGFIMRHQNNNFMQQIGFLFRAFFSGFHLFSRSIGEVLEASYPSKSIKRSRWGEEKGKR